MRLFFVLTKQEKKEIRKYIIGATGVPNSSNAESNKYYKAYVRALEKKLTTDAAFVKEVENNRQSFIEFLRSSNLEPYPPLQEFLNRDIVSFVKKKKNIE